METLPTLPSLSPAPPPLPCWGKGPLTRGRRSLFKRWCSTNPTNACSPHSCNSCCTVQPFVYYKNAFVRFVQFVVKNKKQAAGRGMPLWTERN